jgi:hypothetical protein
MSTCYNRMFHVFQMYVAYISTGCCKSRFGVAMTIHIYCKCMFQFRCFKRMLQVFYLDIAYVALTIHVCCKYMFQMFQLFQTYVASVLSRYFIYCTDYTCMLLVYVSNVSTVLNVCYKCFYLDVTYVIVHIHICCKRML